jgi:hypothetical protein
MKLEISDIELIKNRYTNESFVRISIGGYMFMDTPTLKINESDAIYDNLLRRID